MRMKCFLQRETLRPDLLVSVERLSGQNIRECYQCGKCSAGCPMSVDMDIPPNQITRLLQLGYGDVALRSRAIWMCVSCETCTTRCPREVDLAAVTDALRNIAISEGIRSPVRPVTLFNRIFLGLVSRYGRVFEMELIGRFNTGTLSFFKDVTKAPRLFLKGRLKLWPSFAGRRTAREVFKQVKALRSSERQGGLSPEGGGAGSPEGSSETQEVEG